MLQIRLDRLLPRHQPRKLVQFGWNVIPERRFPKQKEHMTMATIVDISLGGALIDVPAPLLHNVGDTVAIRFGGVDGAALVRHCRESEDRSGTTRYGVEWCPGYELAAMIERAVTTIRGREAELRHAWEGITRTG